MGSGENSCVLHYISNRKEMKGGNLLVSDVGAEYHGYTADVSRTIPVDGHFSNEEALIYNVVFEAQKAGIEASKAGIDEMIFVTSSKKKTGNDKILEYIRILNSEFYKYEGA